MELKDVVKEKYGQAALRVHTGGSSCCGAGAALDGCCDPTSLSTMEVLSRLACVRTLVRWCWLWCLRLAELRENW